MKGSTTFIRDPEEHWKPKWWTTPKGAVRDEGKFISEFSERFLVAKEGQKAGEPLKLTNWQEWLLGNIFARDEDNLFCTSTDVVMIPRKNGKTMMIAVAILFSLLTAPMFAEIYSAAKDKVQASLVYDMLEAWIHMNPYLREYLEIKKTTKTIVNKKTRAFYRPLSADSGGVNGLNPYVIVADEVHIWEAATTSKRARDFWGALTTGSAAQKTFKIIVISTAGSTKEGTLLGDLYLKGVRIAEGEEEDDKFGFYCWQADEADDPLDEATWYKANPNLAEGLLSIEYFRAKVKETLSTGFAFFERMHLNLWVSMAGQPYIEPLFWQAVANKDLTIPKRSKVVAGFDGSQTDDSTAIVIMDVVTGTFKIWEIWEKPVTAGPEWAINREQVEESLKKLHKQYDVVDIWADSTYFTPDLKRWGNHYNWEVTIIPQTNSRMIPMGQDFKKDIADEVIWHTDEEALNRHVQNALLRDDGAYTKETKGSTKKIDALVASVLANGARRAYDNYVPLVMYRG